MTLTYIAVHDERMSLCTERICQCFSQWWGVGIHSVTCSKHRASCTWARISPTTGIGVGSLRGPFQPCPRQGASGRRQDPKGRVGGARMPGCRLTLCAPNRPGRARKRVPWRDTSLVYKHELLTGPRRANRCISLLLSHVPLFFQWFEQKSARRGTCRMTTTGSLLLAWSSPSLIGN